MAALLIDGGEHLLLAHKEAETRSGHESDRCVVGLGVGGRRAPVGNPRLPTPIKHRGLVKPEGSQHPPHPGGPDVHKRVVDNDPAAVAYPMAGYHCTELLGQGKHKWQTGRQIGQLLHEINMPGARDMALGPGCSPTPVAASALRQELTAYRAIENAQVGAPSCFSSQAPGTSRSIEASSQHKIMPSPRRETSARRDHH